MTGLTSVFVPASQVPRHIVAVKYENPDAFLSAAAQNPGIFGLLLYEGVELVGGALIVQASDDALYIDTIAILPEFRSSVSGLRTNLDRLAGFYRHVRDRTKELAEALGVSRVLCGTLRPKAFQKLVPDAEYVETIYQVRVD